MTILPPDKLPPHSSEAEAGLMGCALVSPDDCLPKILAAIPNRSYFYDQRHKLIFEALIRFHRAGKPVDLITIQQDLKDAGMLEQVGGLGYLSQLQDTVPSAANWSYYAEILREKAKLREMLTACTNVVTLIQDGKAPFDEVIHSTQSRLAEVFGGPTGNLPEVEDAADFLSQVIIPPPELVAGVLHQGSKLAFGGSSKSYKTWCLLDLAISVATGTDWLGRATSQGKVLFVNFEIQRHAWQRRISDIAKAKGIAIPPGAINFWNLRGHAADFRKLIPRIIQRARREGYVLIVLDPIYKLYGGTDENAAGDVAELLNSLETLAAQTGAAIAFGAHFAKGNAAAKEAIDRISGSGVFARDPDSLLIFTKHEEENAFTVEFILRNFAPVAPFVVRWQFPLMVRADDLNPTKLKQNGGRPRKYPPEDLLGLLPPEGLTNKDWLLAATAQGMANATYYEVRKTLEKAQKVLKSAHSGKWLPILAKEKP